MKFFALCIKVFIVWAFVWLVLKTTVFWNSYYFNLWNRSFVYKDIPQWKQDIYKDNNIPTRTMLKLEAVAQIECWRDDWMCINSSDCWPFQINQMHREMYNECKADVQAYKWNMINCNPSDSAWCISAEIIRNDLYIKQANWTLNRWLHYVRKYDRFSMDDKERARRLFVIHNWNNRRSCWWKEWKYCYAEKAWVVYKWLQALYNKRTPWKE